MHALVLAAIITVVAPSFGTVADVRVQSDDGVSEGDVVVAFDTTLVDLRIAAANAELGAAEESRDDAARKLDAFTRIDAAITTGNIEAATLSAGDELKTALADPRSPAPAQRRRRAAERTSTPPPAAVLAAQAAVDEVKWRAAHPKGASVAGRGAQLHNEVAAAAKRVERATANVARVNAELAATHVASTATGTVKAVLVSAGQRVSKGQALVRIDTGE